MTTMPYSQLSLLASDFENPRTQSGLGDEDLESLARSIATHGLFDDLLVTPEGTILGGQRRYLAIGMILERVDWADSEIDWPAAAARFRDAGVPVKVVSVRDEADAEVVALAHNLDREDLTSYERAAAIARLRRHLPQKEIAKRLARSEASVSQYCRAWEGASQELKTAWASCSVTFDEVRELAKRPPAEQAQAVAAKREGRPANPRGPRGRPGIMELRALAEQLVDDAPPADPQRRAGAVAVARWALGEIGDDELWEEIGPRA